MKTKGEIRREAGKILMRRNLTKDDIREAKKLVTRINVECESIHSQRDHLLADFEMYSDLRDSLLELVENY